MNSEGAPSRLGAYPRSRRGREGPVVGLDYLPPELNPNGSGRRGTVRVSKRGSKTSKPSEHVRITIEIGERHVLAAKSLAGYARERTVYPRVRNLQDRCVLMRRFCIWTDWGILRVASKAVILLEKMVLPDRIELSTSPLPMECSTTELRQHARDTESAETAPARRPILATRPPHAQARGRAVAPSKSGEISAGRRLTP
jgi:hypothetical protein